MQRIIAVALIALFFAFAAVQLVRTLVPSNRLGPDHAAARAYVKQDKIAEAAAIYDRLAQKDDAVAINNLAVLKFRGIGVEKDGAEAAHLFQRASKLGLARADLNILLATTYGCPNSTDEDQRMAELERLMTSGDPLAASYLADCLVMDSRSAPLLEGHAHPGERLLAAARIATATGDADEQLHFGFKLAAAAISARNRDPGTEPIWDMVQDLAQAAMNDFAAAEKQQRVAAFEGYSHLATLGDDLGDGALATRIKAKSEDDWLEEAAGRGHTISACSRAAKFIRGWIAELNKPAPQPPTKNEIVRFQSLTGICRKTPIPPGYAYREGKRPTDVHAAEVNYDRRFDRWIKDDAFVIAAPAYRNFEHDYLRADEARGLLGLLARRGLEVARANAPVDMK